MKPDYTNRDKLLAKLPKDCTANPCELDAIPKEGKVWKALDAADPLQLVPGAFYDVDQRAGEKGNITERYQFKKHTLRYDHVTEQRLVRDEQRPNSGRDEIVRVRIHVYSHIWFFT